MHTQIETSGQNKDVLSCRMNTQMSGKPTHTAYHRLSYEGSRGAGAYLS